MELLVLIGSRTEGLTRDAAWLSIELVEPCVANHIKPYDLTVHRKRTANERLLKRGCVTS